MCVDNKFMGQTPASDTVGIVRFYTPPPGKDDPFPVDDTGTTPPGPSPSRASDVKLKYSRFMFDAPGPSVGLGVPDGTD